MSPSGLLSRIFEPGFFSNGPVQTAVMVGGLAAVVSGIVGILTVVRGQSFAGHALSDIGTAGGSGAFLVGLNSPLYGFIVMNVVAAGVMEAIGVRRPRGRDVATGIVLGASLGLAALFLYLGTTQSSTTGATVSVLFGSIFTLEPGLLPAVLVMAVGAVGVVVLLYRPLILSSLSEDLAAARGIPTRVVGMAYLIALAVAVSLSAVTIGAILSTALLVGPAATALRVTRRPGVAMGVAALIGTLETWAGILLAYDSYYWFPDHRAIPVSFFVVSIVLGAYLVVQLVSATSRRQPAKAPQPHGAW